MVSNLGQNKLEIINNKYCMYVQNKRIRKTEYINNWVQNTRCIVGFWLWGTMAPTEPKLLQIIKT